MDIHIIEFNSVLTFEHGYIYNRIQICFNFFVTSTFNVSGDETFKTRIPYNKQFFTDRLMLIS